MPSMEDKVKELFAVMLQVSPDEISDKTSPENVELWDSLHHLILVSGFEEEFNIDIEPEETVQMYKDFQTFKSVILQKLV